MNHVETPSVKQRVGAVLASGMLAASTMLAPMAAFAAYDDPNGSSVGDQTGSGVTDLKVKLLDAASGEHGGPGVDPGNPSPDPSDPDAPGANIAFTVPSSIGFVAKADGVLIAPSSDAVYVKNLSNFADHVSSLQVVPQGNWSIVEDATSVTMSNAVNLTLQAGTDTLNASDYAAKMDVTAPAQWNMSPTGAATTNYVATADGTAQDGKTYYTDNTGATPASVSVGDSVDGLFESAVTNHDEVHITTAGHINNVTNDLTVDNTFGQIKWYVTSRPAVETNIAANVATDTANVISALKGEVSGKAQDAVINSTYFAVVLDAAQGTSKKVVDDWTVTSITENAGVVSAATLKANLSAEDAAKYGVTGDITLTFDGTNVTASGADVRFVA